MKYIIYVNGIVWDSVNAKNKTLALKKAKALVRKDFTEFPESINNIELETEKSFLGK